MVQANYSHALLAVFIHDLGDRDQRTVRLFTPRHDLIPSNRLVYKKLNNIYHDHR